MKNWTQDVVVGVFLIVVGVFSFPVGVGGRGRGFLDTPRRLAGSRKHFIKKNHVLNNLDTNQWYSDCYITFLLAAMQQNKMAGNLVKSGKRNNTVAPKLCLYFH